MKSLIAIILAVCSLGALGYERMDFDWVKIPGVDGVALDRRNASETSNVRKYWIKTYSFTFLRETNCETLVSKILSGNGYSHPATISLINGAIQPRPMLLPLRPEFMVAPMEVVENDKAISSFACSL